MQCCEILGDLSTVKRDVCFACIGNILSQKWCFFTYICHVTLSITLGSPTLCGALAAPANALARFTEALVPLADSLKKRWTNMEYHGIWPNGIIFHLHLDFPEIRGFPGVPFPFLKQLPLTSLWGDGIGSGIGGIGSKVGGTPGAQAFLASSKKEDVASQG